MANTGKYMGPFARFFFVGLLMVCFWPTQANADQAAIRAKVLANQKANQRALKASGFSSWNRRVEKGTGTTATHYGHRPLTRGPTAVPHKAIVFGESRQPSVLFDKGEHRLKRNVLYKAAKLRTNTKLSSWQKIERIQKVIRQKVSHAGNELSFALNPNPYTRFNKKSEGKLVRLGDYLKVKKVACREMAFLTQAALEAAGFEARLVSGTMRDGRGKALGGHAWNEVKLDGKWQMVDTTNPQFNRTDPQVAKTRGTGGWIWDRHPDRFEVGSRTDWAAFKANDRPY